MKILSFRIENFRSIIDTGWVKLSFDNVTTLVGQNESGKSAVLDALALTFSHLHPTSDDIRFGDELPVIWLETFSQESELEQGLKGISDENYANFIRNEFISSKGTLLWRFGVEKIEKGVQIAFSIPTINWAPIPPPALENAVARDEQLEEFASTIRAALYGAAPTFVVFEEESGLLPNRIDIGPDGELSGNGASAAANFLTIAGVNLKNLTDSDTKSQTTLLRRANKKITEDFRAFWKQNIGEVSGIELSCLIHQHPAGKEKQGQSFLEFLISDGDNTLHPRQRSRGTRWFISFFLQLRASEEDESDHFYLLDEPGSNLHERAQDDVLELIEKIRQKIGVIYSTHSPHLISEDHLHRIVAIERNSEIEGHPTRLIGAHALGAANTDTLSPIYTAMGASLARQTAIKQKNNVILEELSAHYYLKAFWKLTKSTQSAYFLPATGTSNIAVFANLFLGWGLEFIVVLDDEGSGRGVFNKLKKDIFLDDPDWARRRMLKISGCDGIEDVFSTADYKSFVAGDIDLKPPQRNSGWAKAKKVAKAMHALKFMQRVDSEEISFEDFDGFSKKNIQTLVDEICKRLANYSE
ncbi:ATP-dependent nuclease [Variovorax boronicumulans]